VRSFISGKVPSVRKNTRKMQTYLSRPKHEQTKEMETIKRFNGGTNRPQKMNSQNPTKLDEHKEIWTAEKVVPFNMRQELQRARTAAAMSQSDLAKKIAEPVTTIQKIENGSLTNPSTFILSKINRVLKTKLSLQKVKPMDSK
jgi:ribosome-binding protein aMBF1 (putative translation factor)